MHFRHASRVCCGPRPATLGWNLPAVDSLPFGACGAEQATGICLFLVFNLHPVCVCVCVWKAVHKYVDHVQIKTEQNLNVFSFFPPQEATVRLLSLTTPSAKGRLVSACVSLCVYGTPTTSH